MVVQNTLIEFKRQTFTTKRKQGLRKLKLDCHRYCCYVIVIHLLNLNDRHVIQKEKKIHYLQFLCHSYNHLLFDGNLKLTYFQATVEVRTPIQTMIFSQIPLPTIVQPLSINTPLVAKVTKAFKSKFLL